MFTFLYKNTQTLTVYYVNNDFFFSRSDIKNYTKGRCCWINRQNRQLCADFEQWFERSNIIRVDAAMVYLSCFTSTEAMIRFIKKKVMPVICKFEKSLHHKRNVEKKRRLQVDVKKINSIKKRLFE
ncbi:hypothetical protein [Lambdina fiscellaria nucleopolyhedrovirus]|uniref:Uncharacterized protein n=1 Tax=Lambdina fiscellaria nucleopolyhedrovirus TaxID=1642929 RepID=A0A0E3URS5_9ABAC|nr:hypothetical protein [Lambdina fiscellaria nucleopolyhedrovirus]AKC91734.1 hypothetical protein [Lambdina fiscellaria nucleopolyhedrovirus]